MSDRLRPRMGFEHLASDRRARLGDLLWEANAASSKLMEFTAGVSEVEFVAKELLLAATATLTPLITAPLAELRVHFPEEATHLSGLEGLDAIAASASPQALWRFVHGTLPALAATLTERLEAWHAG